MKIYISGKITGDRRYKAKFREVEKKLAAADPMSLVQETPPRRRRGCAPWIICACVSP